MNMIFKHCYLAPVSMAEASTETFGLTTLSSSLWVLLQKQPLTAIRGAEAAQLQRSLSTSRRLPAVELRC